MLADLLNVWYSYNTKEVNMLNLRTVQKSDTNPLVRSSDVKIINRTGRTVAQGEFVSVLSGEVVGGTEVREVRQVDPESFVKVYNEGIKAAFSLTSAGFKMFLVVLDLVEQGKYKTDSIRIHYSEVQTPDGTKLSQPTFSRGMGELLNKGFIWPSTKVNMFWICPHMFYKGDRISFIKEYVKSSKC
jgi:hypothetical protein